MLVIVLLKSTDLFVKPESSRATFLKHSLINLVYLTPDWYECNYVYAWRVAKFYFITKLQATKILVLENFLGYKRLAHKWSEAKSVYLQP